MYYLYVGGLCTTDASEGRLKTTATRVVIITIYADSCRRRKVEPGDWDDGEIYETGQPMFLFNYLQLFLHFMKNFLFIKTILLVVSFSLLIWTSLQIIF